MKNYFFLLLFLSTCFLYSCKNELDVTDEWSENTIVYGVLNTEDSIHYIKITKSFLGKGDNNIFAQNADSSQYHGELEVKVEEWKNSSKIQIFDLDTITLYNKQVGIFYGPKQTFYCFKAKLKEGFTYKLLIKNKNTGKIIKSQTSIVPSIRTSSSGFSLQRPSTMNLYWSIFPKYNYTIDFDPSSNGAISRIGIDFYYKELINNDSILKNIGEFSLIQTTGTNKVYKDIPVVETINPGQIFYNYIEQKLKNNLINKKLAYHIEVIVYVGDNNYKKYSESINNNSLLSNEPNAYSNIENGKGLFTVITKTRYKFFLTNDMRTELTINEATKNLGFIK